MWSGDINHPSEDEKEGAVALATDFRVHFGKDQKKPAASQKSIIFRDWLKTCLVTQQQSIKIPTEQGSEFHGKDQKTPAVSKKSPLFQTLLTPRAATQQQSATTPVEQDPTPSLTENAKSSEQEETPLEWFAKTCEDLEEKEKLANDKPSKKQWSRIVKKLREVPFDAAKHATVVNYLEVRVQTADKDAKEEQNRKLKVKRDQVLSKLLTQNLKGNSQPYKEEAKTRGLLRTLDTLCDVLKDVERLDDKRSSDKCKGRMEFLRRFCSFFGDNADICNENGREVKQFVEKRYQSFVNCSKKLNECSINTEASVCAVIVACTKLLHRGNNTLVDAENHSEAVLHMHDVSKHASNCAAFFKDIFASSSAITSLKSAGRKGAIDILKKLVRSNVVKDEVPFAASFLNTFQSLLKLLETHKVMEETDAKSALLESFQQILAVGEAGKTAHEVSEWIKYCYNDTDPNTRLDKFMEAKHLRQHSSMLETWEKTKLLKIEARSKTAIEYAMCLFKSVRQVVVSVQTCNIHGDAREGKSPQRMDDTWLEYLDALMPFMCSLAFIGLGRSHEYCALGAFLGVTSLGYLQTNGLLFLKYDDSEYIDHGRCNDLPIQKQYDEIKEYVAEMKDAVKN